MAQDRGLFDAERRRIFDKDSRVLLALVSLVKRRPPAYIIAATHYPPLPQRFLDDHGSAYAFWFVCGYGDAGLLRARRSQPLVCPWLCRGLCTGLSVWVSSGRLAFWRGRGDLVSRCLGPLAEKDPTGVSVRKESTAPMNHPIAEKTL